MKSTALFATNSIANTEEKAIWQSLYFEITLQKQTSLLDRCHLAGVFNHVQWRGDCMQVSVPECNLNGYSNLTLERADQRNHLVLEQKPACTQVLCTAFNNPTQYFSSVRCRQRQRATRSANNSKRTKRLVINNERIQVMSMQQCEFQNKVPVLTSWLRLTGFEGVWTVQNKFVWTLLQLILSHH